MTTIEVYNAVDDVWEEIRFQSDWTVELGTSDTDAPAPMASVPADKDAVVTAGQPIRITDGTTTLFNGEVTDAAIKADGKRDIEAEDPAFALYDEEVSINVTGPPTTQEVVSAALSASDRGGDFALSYPGTPATLGDAYEAEGRTVRRVLRDMADRDGRIFYATPGPADVTVTFDEYQSTPESIDVSAYDSVEVEMNGASGDRSGTTTTPALGGSLTASIDTTNINTLQLHVGEQGQRPAGGRGLYNGGDGGDSGDLTAFGGGGSTSLTTGTGTELVHADAGGGGSAFIVGGDGVGGGGGARGGLGGDGDGAGEDGQDAEGAGAGGDGADSGSTATDGGVEAVDARVTIESSTVGGGTKGDGSISVTLPASETAEDNTIHVEPYGDSGSVGTIDTSADAYGAAVEKYDDTDLATVQNDITVVGTGGEKVEGTAEDSTSISEYGRRPQTINVSYVRTSSEATDYANELLVADPLPSVTMAVSANYPDTDVRTPIVNQTVTILDPSKGVDETVPVEKQVIEQGQVSLVAGAGVAAGVGSYNQDRKSESDTTRPGSVYGNDRIADNAVDTEQLVDTAVIEQKLADLSVSETKVQDDSIATPKLQAEAVTANEILAGTITALEIAAGTLTANEIDTLALATNEISVGAGLDGIIEFDNISTGTRTVAVMLPSNDNDCLIGIPGVRFAEGHFRELNAEDYQATNGISGGTSDELIDVLEDHEARLDALEGN